MISKGKQFNLKEIMANEVDKKIVIGSGFGRGSKLCTTHKRLLKNIDRLLVMYCAFH
jgi:hypothetical protein